MGTLNTTRLVFAFLLIFVGTARAEENDSEARILFDKGNTYYAEGDYENASKAFEESLFLTSNLSARATILFNLANTYERDGEYSRAEERLRAYEKFAPEADRILVQKRIKRLAQREEERLAALKRVDALQEELTIIRARPFLPTSNGPPPPNYTREIILGSASVGLLTGGVIFALAAKGADNRAAEHCNTDRFCLAGAEKDLNSRNKWALFADVSFGLGLAGAVTTTYFVWKKKRDYNEQVRFFVPSANEGIPGVSFVGTF